VKPLTAIKATLRTARAGYRLVRGVVAPPPAPPAAPVRSAAPSPSEAPPAPVAAPPRASLAVVVEPTPNPDAYKFVVGVDVVGRGAVACPDRAAAVASAAPWLAGLFDVPGVEQVFATRDFVTVTRDSDGPTWGTLRHAVVARLDALVPR